MQYFVYYNYVVKVTNDNIEGLNLNNFNIFGYRKFNQLIYFSRIILYSCLSYWIHHK